jgi:hypothetical protein
MSTAIDPRLLPAAERLLALLPAIFRMRDAQQALALAADLGLAAPDPLTDQPQGPLTSFLGILGAQFDHLEAEVDALYEDQFIETCADWAIPYIGALVGARIIDVGDIRSARRQVADTIARRRAKGTARALADMAGDIVVVPAEAIEYRDFVATAYNPDFPRADSIVTAPINGTRGHNRLLPDYMDQHSWEVRDMREGGRFAYSNIGVRFWPIPARAHQGSVPAPVAGGQPGRLRFSPLGRDLALWRRPEPDNDELTRLPPESIPGPINLRHAVDHPAAYYGAGRSIDITVAGNPRQLSDICFCDLSDRDAAGTLWNRRGMLAHPTKLLIDPVRGRMLLPGDGIGVDPATIKIRYCYGQALPVGGGNFEQQQAPLPNPAIVDAALTGAAASAALAAALADLTAHPNIRSDFGGTMTCPAATTIPNAVEARLWAGVALWPTVALTGDWTISGGAGSRLELRGLRLFNGALIIDVSGIELLTIADCTLDPATARLIIRDSGCKIKIERSIVGAIELAAGCVIEIIDSVIDAGTPNGAAIGGAGGVAAGTLTADRSTFIGDIQLLGMSEVSDCLFAVHPARTAPTPPVTVDRTQSGCLRYSALPPGSRTPRRYRCYPAHADLAPMAPVFASLTYGAAAYATLVSANPAGITLGAENGGEMGVMNALSWHRRQRALDRELPEWVPFGMATATQIMSG